MSQANPARSSWASAFALCMECSGTLALMLRTLTHRLPQETSAPFGADLDALCERYQLWSVSEAR